ncbi:sensor histidine kinase [Fibrella aquatilis]|uniref:histidine kinase n=1 Tax=Fibrella aquatilis TaxID=2817059 RepID=A0A939JV91_9BACT|nr:7TM diverse intracellular signaling domain-containing protein [Fibrella aquatilis]MBO0930607.1 hypothetical protein [Fibrella aquatilis]
MRTYLTIGLLCVTSLAGWAQPIGPIRLSNEPAWPLSQRAYLYKTPNPLTPAQFFAVAPTCGSAVISSEHINLGLEPNDVWLYFRLRNDGTARTVLFTLDRIDIHQVHCFRRRGARIDTLALTGDARPFNSRPVQLNYFAIPIPMLAHEEAEIGVLLEKHNEFISGNIKLLSAAQFLQQVRSDSALIAGFLGVAGFLFVFNLFLWYSLRDRVHLFFMAHQIGIVLYVLSSVGYGYEFIWPNYPYSNSLIMTMLSGVWAATDLFLLKRFLNLTPATSRFAKTTDGLAWFILLISLIGCSLALHRPETLPLPILNLGLVLLMGWLVANAALLVAIFIEQIRLRNQAAYVYAAALSFLLVGSVIYVLTMLNLMNAGHFTIIWLIPGFLWEEIIIAFGLTVRYNRFRQQNFNLQLSLAETRQSATQQILLAQETERQRLAADLHDDLGGTLATIRQRLSAIRHDLSDPQATRQLDALEPLIQKSGHDLRRIAHNLMPPDFGRLGLLAALEQLVNNQPAQPTRFAFIVAGQVRSLPTELELNAYRIVSELVQNIHKHAQAERAAVQLLYQADSVIITVEDDGLGNRFVEKTSGSAGIGLKTSYLRADYIGATLRREASEAGTLVILDIPYPIATNTV